MSAKKAVQGRQAVIVLGMHRSGTSALAGVLAKLGVEPPRSPIPATRNNPKGFWESRELMKFHDGILEAAGTCWSDWERFDPERLAAGVIRDFASDVAGLMDREFGDSPLVLVKDPRMCRMFPLWRNAMRDLDIVPKIVIPFRHPLEVAKSLEARNRFDRYQSLLLWLRHVLDAEFDSRGVERTFVEYSDLLDDWRVELNRIFSDLDIQWPCQPDEAESAVNAYLAPSLRHHEAAELLHEGTHTPDSWVVTAYRCLQLLCRDPADARALRDLDQVRDEFNRSADIYAPLFAEQRQHARDAFTLRASLKKLSATHECVLADSELSRKKDDEVRCRLEVEVERLSALVVELEKSRIAALESFDRERAAGASRETAMVGEIEQLRHKGAARAGSNRILWSEVDAQRKVVMDYRARLEKIEASRGWRLFAKLNQLGAWPDHVCGEGRRDPAEDQLLQESGLFDSDWYLSTYADVEKTGLDPVAHFLSVGAEEGRDPSAVFRTVNYAERHPDVAEACVNPLVHYLVYGRREGREIFDARESIDFQDQK